MIILQVKQFFNFQYMTVQLNDLACDFPTKPINDTHCEDFTYGEYMDTVGPSLTVSRVYSFSVIQGSHWLHSFIVRIETKMYRLE